jgi:hypothetical protein
MWGEVTSVKKRKLCIANDGTISNKNYVFRTISDHHMVLSKLLVISVFYTIRIELDDGH